MLFLKDMILAIPTEDFYLITVFLYEKLNVEAFFLMSCSLCSYLLVDGV